MMWRVMCPRELLVGHIRGVVKRLAKDRGIITVSRHSEHNKWRRHSIVAPGIILGENDCLIERIQLQDVG